MLKRSIALPAMLVMILAASVVARSDFPADQNREQALPAATAAGVWDYLETQDYRSWQMWPDKTAFYPGSDPHGNVLTTYVNGPAMTTLTTGASVMPRGAIIVKENYSPERQLMSVTVMYKAAPGYDTEHNDWFWLKRMPNGSIAAEGKVEGCQGCHQSGTDFVRTAWPR